MHEFSLALEVIELAQSEAKKRNASSILEIRLEVGNLCGVDPAAFESALGLLTPDSVLHNTVINIQRMVARGSCHSCHRDFPMATRLDTCPDCNQFPAVVDGGDQFKVVSLLLD